MARSPLIDTELVPPEPPGRDSASLGPSDSSDSGSDLTGLARDDGSASDAQGTGERRGAGADADVPDAADIGVDHVIEPPHPADAPAQPAAAETQPAPDTQDKHRRARRRGAQHGGRSFSGGGGVRRR